MSNPDEPVIENPWATFGVSDEARAEASRRMETERALMFQPNVVPPEQVDVPTSPVVPPVGDDIVAPDAAVTDDA